MKHIHTFESFLNEASTSWSKMMKDVNSGGSGPWTIVVIENRKVVRQEIVKIKDAIPAHYEWIKSIYPKHGIHIEDGGGGVVWKE